MIVSLKNVHMFCMNFSIIFILYWNLIKNNLVRSSCMQDLCTVKLV